MWLLPTAAATLALSLVNVVQNGSPRAVAPRITSRADVLALRRKHEFVAAWRAGRPPRAFAGRRFDGDLVALGALAPASQLITHALFAPGRRWRGKLFFGSGRAGVNRFGGGALRRGFGARVAPSALDGRPALVLDYAAPRVGDAVWGRGAGMRDELREVSRRGARGERSLRALSGTKLRRARRSPLVPQVAPGVIVGLGSMRATGGARNCAPFVLVDAGPAPEARGGARGDIARRR